MKKRDVINLCIVILFSLYLVFYKTILITKLLKYEELITSLFIVIITFIAYLLLGYRKTKDNQKRKEISGLIIYEIIIYFFAYYGLGIFFGFQNNVYSLKIINIIKNITIPIIIIISSETLRNIMIQSNKDKKIVIVFITILIALLEMMETINYYHIETKAGLFKMVACSLLPLMAKHSMLSYVTYYTGLKNSLIYRLIFEIYIYFVPIVPDLGDYITCLVDLVFPCIIYISVNNILSKHDYVEPVIKGKKATIANIIFTVIFILLICVVGGVFKVKLISIASDSMNPYIYKGDAVVIEKRNENSEYKVGDIISFDWNGRTTVHRISNIETIDNEVYYHTKGDNNNTEDTILVPINNIYGKVLFKIPYIGWPSVLINEVRSGNK